MNERRSRNLDALLAAAAAPPLEEERDERALAEVLTMFNTAGAAAKAGIGTAEPITAFSPVEPVEQADPRAQRRAQRARLVVKCAAVLAIFTGTGIAAASAGILPAPVQSFVHHVLGGIGVPGPSPGSTPGGGVSASASAGPSLSTGPGSAASPATSNGAGGGATGTPNAAASPSAGEASLVTLCTEVQGSGNSWQSTMSAPDQARLIAAAGSANKVHAYCAQLLRSSDGAAATPSAISSGSADTASPAPSATATHGKGKDTGNNAARSAVTPSAISSRSASTVSPAPSATATHGKGTGTGNNPAGSASANARKH